MSRLDVESRLCVLFTYFIAFSCVATFVCYEASNQDFTVKQLDLESHKVIYDELRNFPNVSSPVLFTCISTVAFVSLLVYVAGELTGNWSQVDKLWSLLPTLYIWEVMFFNPSKRVFLMALVSTLWSIRLTYNFTRRGGYGWPPWTGDEDYRWEYVRKWPVISTRVGGSLFNLLFISIYQNILLFLTASPVLICSLYNHVPLRTTDWLLTVSCILLIYIEYTADQHQFDFQTEKWSRRSAGRKLEFPYSVGFPSHGLFSVCRHPNYTAEMTIWILVYLFSVSAGASLFNWSSSGWILLCLLFQGSTNLSEGITSAKYPLYKRYQEKVPCFLSLFNPMKTKFSSVVQ